MPGIIYINNNTLSSPAKLPSFYNTTPSGKGVSILPTMMDLRFGTEGGIE